MAGSAVRTALGDVRSIVVRAGSLVVSRGPILLALYLAGELARYEVVQFAGWVGAYSAIAGSLLFPFIILCRLVPLVAMLLVLRGGMPSLSRIAPVPTDGASRRRDLLAALLAGVLPFVAFYAAWGYLREDAQDYYVRVLDVGSGLIANEAVFGETNPGDNASGSLTLGPVTIAILVTALLLRLAYERWGDRLPRLVGLVAVYLEALWVFLSAYLVTDVVAGIVDWIRRREAVAWVEDFRAWLGAQLAPLAWVWDGVGWLIGEVGALAGEPLAWLVIAGVIYGQVVAREPTPVEGGSFLVRRMRALVDDVRERIAPVARAIGLLWRSGPILVGGYVLLYTVLLAVLALIDVGLTRLFGPKPFGEWRDIGALVFLVAPVIIEPLRVCLVAGAYDTAIGVELRSAPAAEVAVEVSGGQESRAKRNVRAPETSSSANGPASSGTR